MIRLIVAATFALGLPLVATGAESPANESARYGKLAAEGARLSAEQVEKLESAVKANPEDLAARAQLLGYYYVTQPRQPDLRVVRQGHVLWMIEHHPEVVLPGPYVALDPRRDGPAFEEARQFWLEKVKTTPDLRMIDRAASFLQMSDRATAEKLWQRAEDAEPENAYWPERLANLYMLDVHAGAADSAAPAARALAELERAQGSAPDLYHNLENLAKMAFVAGDVVKADKYARVLLGAAITHEGEWNYGNAIHSGNMILGRIAFADGNIELAKQRLLAAGETPGSPQLNSFGPNVSLAKELAEKGETATVVAYLKACEKFWKSGRPKLEEWIAILTQGGMPDFGANLDY